MLRLGPPFGAAVRYLTAFIVAKTVKQTALILRCLYLLGCPVRCRLTVLFLCTVRVHNSDIENDGGIGAGGCSDAGGWVIASYVFVIVFTIAPLFLLLSCGCVRIPYPRSIGLSSTFIAFVWTIVAVSKWSEKQQQPHTVTKTAASCVTRVRLCSRRVFSAAVAAAGLRAATTLFHATAAPRSRATV